MKIAVLLTAVALASGAALAATSSSTYDSRDTTATHKAPVVNKDKRAAVTSEAPRKEGIVDKTKSAIRRMGEKLGHATERLPGNKASRQAANDPSRTEASRTEASRTEASRSDTRSMGAASDDSARQRRMDEAYNNWHAKQK